MSLGKRLRIVESGDELHGVGPTQFEQIARSTTPGSRDHRGVVRIVATLCRPALSVLVPPSGREELTAAVTTALGWCRGRVDTQGIKGARARAFGAVDAIEDLTARAVQGFDPGPVQPETPLDQHADAVTLRYARLSAHFATAACCHLLDGCLSPEKLLESYSDLQGARAYQLAGLGSARHQAFRQAAWDQATWEAGRRTERPHREQKHTSRIEAAQGSLAIQIFHEYLGGRHRAHAEAVGHEMQRFVAWALSGRRPN